MTCDNLVKWHTILNDQMYVMMKCVKSDVCDVALGHREAKIDSNKKPLTEEFVDRWLVDSCTNID